MKADIVILKKMCFSAHSIFRGLSNYVPTNVPTRVKVLNEGYINEHMRLTNIITLHTKYNLEICRCIHILLVYLEKN